VRALPGYQYVVKDVTLHAKMGDILLVCGSEGAGTQGQCDGHSTAVRRREWDEGRSALHGIRQAVSFLALSYGHCASSLCVICVVSGKSVLLKALAGVSKPSNCIRGRATFQVP
jgi:energy-coupling factor transporter ATP-binding protein EcfA2